MCSLGKEIKRFEVSKENAIIGYRGWYIVNPLGNSKKERVLKSLNCDFIWDKDKDIEGNVDDCIDDEIPLGIYCYNNDYNYYYKHNYYYNYNYNYNYNYYNYNYNYNYNYIAGTCYQFGKIIEHEQGYRSNLARPKSLVILDDPKWFDTTDKKKFANHFNGIVKNVAKEYNCEVIPFSEYSKWS